MWAFNLALSVFVSPREVTGISKWLQTLRITPVSDPSHYLAYTPLLWHFIHLASDSPSPLSWPEWLMSFPQQKPLCSSYFCLPDLWHDLQYDPVLCYPQKPRDGLESACTPEQESWSLKIDGYFPGVLFLLLLFFIVVFFSFFATNF